MWCIAFGIYTVELFYIGHNIIGHWMIITAVFFTFFVFKTEKARNRREMKWIKDFVASKSCKNT